MCSGNQQKYLNKCCDHQFEVSKLQQQELNNSIQQLQFLNRWGQNAIVEHLYEAETQTR